jgi:hypothetical protein
VAAEKGAQASPRAARPPLAAAEGLVAQRVPDGPERLPDGPEASDVPPAREAPESVEEGRRREVLSGRLGGPALMHVQGARAARQHGALETARREMTDNGGVHARRRDRVQAGQTAARTRDGDRGVVGGRTNNGINRNLFQKRRRNGAAWLAVAHGRS